jgi:general stress protein 26
MKIRPLKNMLLFTFLFAANFLAPRMTNAQNPTVPDRDKIISAAKAIMKKSHYCSMITNLKKDFPQARAIDPFLPDDDMVVLVGTKSVTRKVEQIKKDPHVTLFYLNPDGSGYVSLMGKATLLNDVNTKKNYWKKEWDSFYRDKNLGDDYLLIQIKPVRIEVVSYSDGILNDPVSWRPASINFGE